MEVLEDKDSLYSFSSNPSKRHLTIFDREPRGDLGNPDRKTWYFRTKELLDHGWGDTNIIIWSWCGQVSGATREDIEIYLELMDSLEKEYPEVIFIYMTGHLDGTGEAGNLNLRNNQIRDYCHKNKKVLYDFADIESYDPDGQYFMDLNAKDRCDYLENGLKRNWAAEWCESNPGECSLYECAHSMSLNCDMKGKAFWWLMARLADGLQLIDFISHGRTQTYTDESFVQPSAGKESPPATLETRRTQTGFYLISEREIKRST